MTNYKYHISIFFNNNNGQLSYKCEDYRIGDNYIALERPENNKRLIIIPLSSIKYLNIDWIEEE